MKGEKKRTTYLAPGHHACPGCTVPIGVRAILETVGGDVIVVTPTGCLETFTSTYDLSAWEVSWIHPIFENAAAVASGVRAALDYRGDEKTLVVVIGGDGATYDIGMGSLSGMFERNERILYICYDNEAYMNTGIQRSGATPFAAHTTTSPVGRNSFGEQKRKKDLIQIALAHGLQYVATASIAYLTDLRRKVKEALKNDGASFIELLTPCNLGWGIEPEESVELARLAVQTGLFPLLQYQEGVLTAVKKINKIKPVEAYLKRQKRFQHLFSHRFQSVLVQIQEQAHENIHSFDLIREKEIMKGAGDRE